MSNRNKGIILIILSAFGFAMMSAFVKLAGDLPSIQKAFFRNVISFSIALAMIIRHKESLLGKKENQRLLLMRSAFGTLGVVLNFYAIDHLILSDANMLNKLSPFFVLLFCAVFLKEKLSSNHILTIIVGFLGALLIIKPAFNIDIIPYIAGLSSAVCAGAAYSCIRAIGNKEKHYTVVFYFSFFSVVTLLPMMVANYKPMTGIQFAYLILAGIFATVGQFAITLAYRYAPAREISIFDYSNIIFSALIGFAIFDQVPDIISVLGYLIIFSASFYMFLYNKKLDKKIL